MFIEIDPQKTVRPVKPMHGVGQPPFLGVDFSTFSYLRDAGIPFSRLHDVQGAFGKDMYVDIPNIFRDFDADPADPASYDFAFTDLLMKALHDYGVEPFFRLGVTIENYQKIRAYRIFPPKDNLKWAKICEGIIRHYNEGWANGFSFGIRYFEIWNEPDNNGPHPEGFDNQMWTGTKEEYFALYDVTSKYLKEKFPDIRIGGYASCGFYELIYHEPKRSEISPKRAIIEHYYMTFFDEFLAYVRKNGCPLDFFSWHSYANPKHTVLFAEYARKKLDEYGFTDTETTCNEWNPDNKQVGTPSHAALCASEMIELQRCGAVDSAMFYDARIGVSDYGGMFSPATYRPYPAYYSFAFFNELYRLGNETEVTAEPDLPEGVSLLAAANDAKDTVKVMISNPTDHKENLFGVETNDRTLTLTAVSVIDAFGRTELPPSLPRYLHANTVLLLTFTKKAD